MGPEGSTVVLGVHREARGPQEMGSGPGDFFEVTLVRAAHVAGNARSKCGATRHCRHILIF